MRGILGKIGGCYNIAEEGKRWVEMGSHDSFNVIAKSTVLSIMKIFFHPRVIRFGKGDELERLEVIKAIYMVIISYKTCIW